jgi:hypothetical protein
LLLSAKLNKRRQREKDAGLRYDAQPTATAKKEARIDIQPRNKIQYPMKNRVKDETYNANPRIFCLNFF